MATSMYGSICIEDLFAGRIVTGQDGRQWLSITDLATGPFQVGKNGKHYANIGLWINDQPDNYGNHGSISLSQTKDERAANVKRTYVGNMKWSGQQQQAAPAPVQQGYAPQVGPAGFPPAQQAGFPPAQQAGFPPAAQPGYPAQPQGYPAQAAPGYPPQQFAAPQPAGYPGQQPAQQPAYNQPKAPVNGDLPF